MQKVQSFYPSKLIALLVFFYLFFLFTIFLFITFYSVTIVIRRHNKGTPKL